MEMATSLSSYELERVRFAKGAFAPRGQLYYPKEKREVTNEQVKKAIRSGINRNISLMLRIPGPIAGVSGIRFMAKRINKWRDKLGPKKAGSYLAQLVRMQEEIGTGGGGFRFIYGSFSPGILCISSDTGTVGHLCTVYTIWRYLAIRGSTGRRNL